MDYLILIKEAVAHPGHRRDKIVTIPDVADMFKKAVTAEVTKAMMARRKMAGMAKPKRQRATTALNLLVNTSWRKEGLPKGGMPTTKYVK